MQLRLSKFLSFLFFFSFFSLQKMTLRLKQIEREDLADFLSKTVMKEKSDAVKRTFLDDPMKDLIARNSPMLMESPKGTQWISKRIFVLHNAVIK